MGRIQNTVKEVIYSRQSNWIHDREERIDIQQTIQLDTRQRGKKRYTADNPTGYMTERKEVIYSRQSNWIHDREERGDIQQTIQLDT